MPTQVVPAGMPAHLPYPVSPNYRCGDFGGWSLKLKSAETEERGFFTGWGPEPAGHYLENDGHCWMSTSRLERESHAVHLKHARGTVVVCGVGMGMYLYNIAAKPQVERIIAVDRDPAVVNLMRQVSDFDAWAGRDKVQFVHKDALHLTANDLGHAAADYLYVDIWPEFGDPEAAAQTLAIQNVVGAKSVGWWGQELDFIEWAFQHRPPNHAVTVNDLRAFVEWCGLPIEERSAEYVQACRRAGEVYATYGSLPFAEAMRDRLNPALDEA